MSKPTMIFVKGAIGRVCRKPTLDHSRYKGPDGERRDRSIYYSDEVYEVPNDRFHRRRIAKGDLELTGGPARRATPATPVATKPAAKKAEKGSDR